MPPKKGSLEPAWSRPECTGTVPSRRSGHTLTLVPQSGAAFLWGGMRLGSDGGALTSELYRLNLQQGFHWTKETAAGRVPPPTWRHTANLFDDSHVLIFGGFTSEAEKTDEVWVLNTEHMTWSRPVGSAKVKSRVGKSGDGGGSSGDNLSDVSGGQGGSGGTNAHPDLGDDKRPSPRGSHSATVVGRDLVVFGGYGGQGFGRADFNDLYALSLRNWQWRSCTAHGTAPEPRSGHTASLVQGRWLFIVGGWNSQTQFQDVHILDMAPTDKIKKNITQIIVDENEIDEEEDP